MHTLIPRERRSTWLEDAGTSLCFSLAILWIGTSLENATRILQEGGGGLGRGLEVGSEADTILG